MAKNQIKPLSEQLISIEEQKYSRNPILLRNLDTGEMEQVYALKDRPDITGFDKKRLTRAEMAIHKKMIKYNKSIRTFPQARAIDAESEKNLTKMVEEFDSLSVQSNYLPTATNLKNCLSVDAKIKHIESLAKPLEPVTTLEEGKSRLDAPPSFKEKFFGRWFR
jgi:hypothetical protein